MSARCQVCGREGLLELLDVGAQPVANRFLATQSDVATYHRLTLAQCQSCAMVQLMPPIKARNLQPLVDWVIYREPEAHLDALVTRVAERVALNPGSSVAGISVKDDSTLDRFRKRGIANVWRLDPKIDLGIESNTAGVE